MTCWRSEAAAMSLEVVEPESAEFAVTGRCGRLVREEKAGCWEAGDGGRKLVKDIITSWCVRGARRRAHARRLSASRTCGVENCSPGKSTNRRVARQREFYSRTIARQFGGPGGAAKNYVRMYQKDCCNLFTGVLQFTDVDPDQNHQEGQTHVGAYRPTYLAAGCRI